MDVLIGYHIDDGRRNQTLSLRMILVLREDYETYLVIQGDLNNAIPILAIP
jgi:hypothetical protein